MTYSNAWDGWAGQFLRAVGAPATRTNLLFMQAWQAGEGSNARYNPLNTTRSGYAGSSNYLPNGVKNFVSPQQGIQANADALVKTGYYNDIVNALRAGNVAPSRLASLVIASPWGTKHFPDLGSIHAAQDPTSAQSQPAVQASQASAAVDQAASNHPRYDMIKTMDTMMQAIINPAMVDPQAPTSQALSMAERAGPITSMFLAQHAQQSAQQAQQPAPKPTGFPTFGSLANLQQVLHPATAPISGAPLPQRPMTGGGPVGTTTPGNYTIKYGKGQAVMLPTKFKATHDTDGISGYQPSLDIMGHPGEPVLAPEAGRIVYWHVNGAQGGGSMEFIGNSGRKYWLGHLDNGLPGGTQLGRGQALAVISSRHPRPHVHIGILSG